MIDVSKLYKGQKMYYKNSGQVCWFIRHLRSVERVLVMHVDTYGPTKNNEQAYKREKLTEYHISHFTSRPIFTLNAPKYEN